MDANGLRFWMLADEDQWLRLPGPDDGAPATTFDPERRSLRLTSRRPLSPLAVLEPSTLRGNALARLARVPQTIDRFHTRAFWDETAGAVMATGAFPTAVPIFETAVPPTDLAMGYDGILYLALDGGVTLVDRRGRWQPAVVRLDGFTPWRLAADPAGGVWALDRAGKQLARLSGQPLPERARGRFTSATFRPSEENPDPPALKRIAPAVWEPAELPVALACSPSGTLAVLNWIDQAGGADAVIRTLTDGQSWDDPFTLRQARYPVSLTWLSDHHVAILLTELPAEAPVYQLSGAGEGRAIWPSGDFYPLNDHSGGPFLNGVTLPPHFPLRTRAGSRPLHRLSLPTYAHSGEATGWRPFDSGRLQTAWHRLYLEADLPADCGIVVMLAASDKPAAPDIAAAPEEWHEHRFGRLFDGDQDDPRLPRGAWVSYPSEIPHHPGLSCCPPAAGRSGLFTALISRPRRKTRTLRGRYLHVRVRLLGSGRASPELWALRAYGGRFSYVENYLPALYRESLFGPDAHAVTAPAEPATPADFLERFVDNFEGVLTPLEDRVAAGYLLTDPRSAPENALDWLGGWIGRSLTAIPDPAVKRRLIAHGARLDRRRGTLRGLQLALDLVTGGAVSGGEIVIVEQWRLRRTFATILGADLAAEEDPLLPGLAISGNSFVGETLFLGDESRREFLALFNADLDVTAGEAAVIQTFFESLAFRLTILVHDQISPQDLGLIRRVVGQEVPAHLEVNVVPAAYSFLVGVAGLIGVDTYLTPDRPLQPVRVDRSEIGVGDLIHRPASLDPRLEGGPVL